MEDNEFTTNSNDTIDQVTLELLMNKQQFQKYKKQQFPEEYTKDQQYLADLETHKDTVIELTTHLLNNPYDPISNDVNEMFEQYCKCLIRHFKMKELENEPEWKREKEDEPIFSNISSTQTMSIDNTLNQSLWGKSIIKGTDK
jgi:hypothetical protein